MINSCIAKRQQIMKQIDEMEIPLHAEVLRGYYLQDKSLKQIAEENGCTHQYIRRVHMEALKVFDNKYLR